MANHLADNFVLGALEGVGCVLRCALAVVLGVLLVQLLVSAWFWLVLGVALLIWICVRGSAPSAPAKAGSRAAAVADTVGWSDEDEEFDSDSALEDDDFELDDWDDGDELAPPALEPVPLLFGPGEPSVFYPPEAGLPYRGHTAAKKRIDRAIESMPRGRFTALLVGSGGIGKRTLARITAHRIKAAQLELGLPASTGTFYVLEPERLTSAGDVRAAFAEVEDYDIVYLEAVDRVAALAGTEPLLELLALPGRDEPGPLTPSPPHVPRTVSWIASTSSAAALDPHLRRLLRPEIRLRDPSPEVIAELLHDREMQIHPDAAFEIAERAAPSPGRALAMYAEAREFALGDDSPIILPNHVRDACEVMGWE